ncbi:MAG: TetR/AcrR family transcriptional regulator [Acidimicrobiia bacterium]
MASPTTAESPTTSGPIADVPARGRPRSARRSAAVIAAALEEIAERGIGGMSIESVAARAGVSKVTVYRRWPDKIALGLAALESLPELEVPDTGNLVDDLRRLRAALLDVFAHSNLADVLPALMAERRRSDHGEAIRRYVESRSRPFVVVVERAIARGEIPPAMPTDLLAHLFSSPLAMSVMNRDQPLTDDEWTGVITTIVRGLHAPKETT